MANINLEAARRVPADVLDKFVVQLQSMAEALGETNVKRVVVGPNAEPGMGFKPLEGYAVVVSPQTPFKARFFNTEEMFRGCAVSFFAHRQCDMPNMASTTDDLTAKHMLKELRTACVEIIREFEEDSTYMSLKFSRRSFPTCTMFIDPRMGHHYLACEAHMLPTSAEVEALLGDDADISHAGDTASSSDDELENGMSKPNHANHRMDMGAHMECVWDSDSDSEEDGAHGYKNGKVMDSSRDSTQSSNADFTVAIERLAASGATFESMFVPSNSRVNMFLRRYYASQKAFRERLCRKMRERLLHHYLSGEMLRKELRQSNANIVSHSVTNAVHQLGDGNLVFYSNTVDASLGNGALVYGGPFKWSAWVHSEMGRKSMQDADMLSVAPFCMPKSKAARDVVRVVAMASRENERDKYDVASVYGGESRAFTHVYAELPDLRTDDDDDDGDFAFETRRSGDPYMGDAMWYDAGVYGESRRLSIASDTTTEIVRLYSPHEWLKYVQGLESADTRYALKVLGMSLGDERTSFLAPTYSATLTYPVPMAAFYTLNNSDVKIVV